jgi:uncharacterized Zn finger protein
MNRGGPPFRAKPESSGPLGPDGTPRRTPFAPLAQPTAKPRKVRGGFKLETKAGPVSMAWAGQRLMRVVEELATGDQLTEGVEYARLGQTRVLTITPGHVHARVQGRMPTAYAVDIRLPVFTFDQWEQVIGAMVAESRYLAALLSGDVPAGIDDLFSPLRLHLFPAEASHLSVTCTCGKARAQYLAAMQAAGQMPPATLSPVVEPWCKHVCCVMALIAERTGKDAFLMMELRGLAKDDLLERLRQRRAIAAPRGPALAPSTSDGEAPPPPPDNRPVPVYMPRIPGVSDAPSTPLDQDTDRFWTAGAELNELDLAIGPPEVNHALLRRLGPSPFPGGKFPLLGLLSTCYTVISERAVAEAEIGPGAGNLPETDRDAG